MEEETKPKRRKVNVRIVEQEGESALVEWTEGDDLRRAYVPVDKLETAETRWGFICAPHILSAGIPYGAPWETLIDTSRLTPEAIGRELRRKGFWTSADIQANMRIVPKAVNTATGLSAASLFTLAQKHEED